MTEQERLEISERWRRGANVPWNADWESSPPPYELLISVRSAPHEVYEFVRNAPHDVERLLNAIDERDAIIHDLQLDGRSLARAAEQRLIAEMIDWAKGRLDDFTARRFAADNSWYVSAESAMGELIVHLQERSAFGPNDPHIDPLPPDQARAEADRLRKEVERLTNLLEQRHGGASERGLNTAMDYVG